MKKFVYATLAAATIFASAGAASATTSFDNPVLSTNTGGASYGYNLSMQSFDNYK